jgi:hypothetical protein
LPVEGEIMAYNELQERNKTLEENIQKSEPDYLTLPQKKENELNEVT